MTTKVTDLASEHLACRELGLLGANKGKDKTK